MKIPEKDRGTFIRKISIPITDQLGRLQPKGWNARGAQVEKGVYRLKQLILSHGVDGAAQWLLADHPDEDFAALGIDARKMHDDSGLTGQLPGSFILGPKFGAFAMNLHANHPEGSEKYAKYLTMDKWWSRTWNRFFGTLHEGSAPGEHVEAPRKGSERSEMIESAKRAVKQAGLRNVAELQAVMWYYEQALWRMLGVKQAKSYSFVDGAKAIMEAYKRDAAGKVGHPVGQVAPGRANAKPGPTRPRAPGRGRK
jgi:hypothetical protein